MSLDRARTDSYKSSKFNYKDFESILDDPATALILFTRNNLDSHDIKSVENYLENQSEKIEEEIRMDSSIKGSGTEKWIEHYERFKPVYENVSNILGHRSDILYETSPEEKAMRETIDDKLEKLERRSARLYQEGHTAEDISKFCDVYLDLNNLYEEIVSV